MFADLIWRPTLCRIGLVFLLSLNELLVFQLQWVAHGDVLFKGDKLVAAVNDTNKYHLQNFVTFNPGSGALLSWYSFLSRRTGNEHKPSRSVQIVPASVPTRRPVRTASAVSRTSAATAVRSCPCLFCIETRVETQCLDHFFHICTL